MDGNELHLSCSRSHVNYTKPIQQLGPETGCLVLFPYGLSRVATAMTLKVGSSLINRSWSQVKVVFNGCSALQLRSGIASSKSGAAPVKLWCANLG